MKKKPNVILVLTTVPDRDTGRTISRALVERRLAACASLSGGTESIYWWKGKVTTDKEVTLALKTRADLFTELETALLDLHPYELPELIALPIEDGSRPYLKWIENETKEHTPK